MKSSSHLFCLVAMFCSICWAQNEIDPFADQAEPKKPVIPHRGIVALPSSITYEKLVDDRHQYGISGLYPFKEDSDLKILESHSVTVFDSVLPEGSKVEAEVKGESLIVISSQQIPHDTLAFAIDCIAIGAGHVSTWYELEARDLKNSGDFNPEHYLIEKRAGEFPPGLAWLSLHQIQELRIPFVTAIGSNGTLLISPTTGRCMCHSRFTIRILDENGLLLWKAADPSFGSLQIAISDTNQDQLHELNFKTHDHGTLSRFVVKPKITSAVQPATEPKSDQPVPSKKSE